MCTCKNVILLALAQCHHAHADVSLGPVGRGELVITGSSIIHTMQSQSQAAGHAGHALVDKVLVYDILFAQVPLPRPGVLQLMLWQGAPGSVMPN